MGKATFTPSRRSALALIAAAPVTALPVVGGADELQRLIEEHRSAYDRWLRLLSRREEIECAYDDQREAIKIPVATGHVLETYGTGSDVADSREQVEGFYASARLALRTMRRLAPDIADRYDAVLTAVEQDNLALVDRLFAEEEARREAFGLAAAERAESAAERAEDAAMTALLAYPPRTLEEARRKAVYLETTRLRDTLSPEAMAFMQSFMGGSAA